MVEPVFCFMPGTEESVICVCVYNMIDDEQYGHYMRKKINKNGANRNHLHHFCIYVGYLKIKALLISLLGAGRAVLPLL